MKKILLFNLLISLVCSQTWADYLTPAIDLTIQVRNGYDSNVLRLSDLEQDRAAIDSRILGAMTTFDAYYYRFGVKLTANYRLRQPDHSLSLRLSPGYTMYMNSPEKQYSTFTFELDYSWGAYRHLKFKVHHLNNYHLREYIDRDVSASMLEVCNFSDADHSVLFSFPVARRTWLSFSGGYLQRYYILPFTEFDLDIVYAGFRFSRTWSRLLGLAFELKSGFADNISQGGTARSSSMDRSYRFVEMFMPVRLIKSPFGLDELGTGLRCEWRAYLVENPNDPLHSGRYHQDWKLDLWVKKVITDGLTIKLNIRYRIRKSESEYTWVSDLKSFNQFKTWLDLDWQPSWF